MILFLTMFILISLISTELNNLYFKYNLKTFIKKSVINFILINSLTFIFLRFVLKIEEIFKTKNVLMYIEVALAFVILIFAIKFIYTAKNNINVIVKEKKTSKGFIAIGVLSTLLFGLGCFVYFGTNWFIDFFGKLTPEQFLFNFNSPLKGTSSDMVKKIINIPVLETISVTSVFVLCLLANISLVYKNRKILTNKILKLILLVISIVTFCFGSYHAYKELDLGKVYLAYFDQSEFIKNNYVTVDKAKLKFPEKKRNLIHIYLESVENSFFDKANGGNEDQNLMPDFAELAKEGIHFSHNDKFGGGYQTYGSSWSVAGNVNFTSGLPLKIPMWGNGYGYSGQFLPGATTIGDILHKEGYVQEYMLDCDADFGGLTAYYTTHGDYKVADFNYAKKMGWIPKDYSVWWGYEDDKLFEFAKNELLDLANQGKPFNFTLVTMDTHFPDGYPSPGMEEKFRSQYANVIFHSQQQVTKFVRWVQQQSFYDNTEIVLTGDHLSMDKDFFKDYPKSYHRTPFNLILNADFKNKNIRTTNRQYAPFDYFPTILSGLGVEIKGDRLALGTDLSSNKKTLIEKYGVKYIDKELSRNSNYYNEEFINERKAKHK